MFAPRAFGAAAVLVDEFAPHDDVLQAEEHVGVGFLAVTPGAADFLVVGVKRAGKIGVENIAHVGLVDAHAESNGGNDDNAFFGHETVLRI